MKTSSANSFEWRRTANKREKTPTTKQNNNNNMKVTCQNTVFAVCKQHDPWTCILNMFGLLAVLSDCCQSNRICCVSSSKVHFKIITSFIVLSHNQICIFLSSCLRSSHFYTGSYTRLGLASMFYEDEDSLIYNYTEISFWHTFWWFPSSHACQVHLWNLTNPVRNLLLVEEFRLLLGFSIFAYTVGHDNFYFIRYQPSVSAVNQTVSEPSLCLVAINHTTGDCNVC